MNTSTIKNDERIIFELRSIYNRFGYSRYRMSKFEEYEFYLHNKDFLISDSVITFTDTNGRLMALKPDVTLSIVKNSRDIPGYVQRLYYAENVYRVSKGANCFRELMQVGLECIGDIDDYCVMEVVQLAAKSLRSISDNSVLNLSSLDVISELLEGVSEEDRKAVFACIGEKNVHELKRLCRAMGMDAARMALLEKLILSFGTPAQVLPGLVAQLGQTPALDRLMSILQDFEGSDLEDMLRIDFSVMGNENYYNGIVFRGFIDGVPSAVLSGGQYDRLMRKLGRKSGAIGFAVYLDSLERLFEPESGYDADILLLYDEDADLKGLRQAVARLNAQGKCVAAMHGVSDKIRCKQTARYRNGEVEIIEDHA